MVEEVEDRKSQLCQGCDEEIPHDEVVMLWSHSAKRFEYWCGACAAQRNPEAQ